MNPLSLDVPDYMLIIISLIIYALTFRHVAYLPRSSLAMICHNWRGFAVWIEVKEMWQKQVYRTKGGGQDVLYDGIQTQWGTSSSTSSGGTLENKRQMDKATGEDCGFGGLPEPMWFSW